MFFLYEVLYFLNLELPITAVNFLYVSSKSLWQYCQCDMMAKGEYVPRAGGSSSEGERGKT
jgi:hypothetical protein